MENRGHPCLADAAGYLDNELIMNLPGFVAVLILVISGTSIAADTSVEVSGIYPHLAMFNQEGECGTGAVVPWADRLWVITYAPHMPRGSSDKLYEITPDLRQIVRPDSIGGTNANRMIHRESNQLFIGPYVIDGDRNVRTIPYSRMFGRHTGNARHLTNPADKIYFMSMEEALYEVDVKTLDVQTLYFDEAIKDGSPKANLPGYHGKGLYSGQGRLVYANNGEHGAEAQRNPFTPSGVLAEWNGTSWKTVLRSQFTEVTGPGGIFGNANPESDPVWSIGWDARSLLLMVLDQGQWHQFRLPKGSHSYDGAHGWNTEWPRIRDVGEAELLMTMHGTFWKFPKQFRIGRTAGILPRSNYLKVIGDFAPWNGRIVFGCDDTARNEFLNKRKAKGVIAAPQSQSNLWFVKPSQMDQLGPVIGRGAVWWQDAVAADVPSDPYLFSGYPIRGVHLAHSSAQDAVIAIEVDRNGNGRWEQLTTVTVPPNRSLWHEFDVAEKGVWVRLKSRQALVKATAYFHSRAVDDRSNQPSAKFAGLTSPGDTSFVGGVIRARGENKGTLHFAATGPDSAGQVTDIGLYELDAGLKLRRVESDQDHQWHKTNAAIPSKQGVLQIDDASVIYLDDAGRRFRLPKGNAAFDSETRFGPLRLAREVATERDLFNCHGSFYELPAENAGGFQRIRPVCTHQRVISDYCSFRGLLVISGTHPVEGNRHMIRSDDGKASLWVGAIDDIWQMGKPRGDGGPWKNTTVKAGQVSDPYLMTGYDRKTLELSSTNATSITMSLDISGAGDWYDWQEFAVPAMGSSKTELPTSLQAYWVRFRCADDTEVTAQLHYE